MKRTLEQAIAGPTPSPFDFVELAGCKDASRAMPLPSTSGLSPSRHQRRLRRSMRLEVIMRLIEEERQKKQRLEWYLQEVLLEKEALLNGMSSGEDDPSSPPPSSLPHYPQRGEAPHRSTVSSTSSSRAPPFRSSLHPLPTPTPTTAPKAERCSSCGKLPFAMGGGSQACRCRNFESVRKRQRRLSLFVRTGHMLDTPDETGTSVELNTASDRASAVCPLDNTAMCGEDENALLLPRVLSPASLHQYRRSGDDSEADEDEDPDESEVSTEDDGENELDETSSSTPGSQASSPIDCPSVAARVPRNTSTGGRRTSGSPAAKLAGSLSHFKTTSKEAQPWAGHVWHRVVPV